MTKKVFNLNNTNPHCVRLVNPFPNLANANNNQSQFQWIVTCNHHDKSECTFALGKPTKFHICLHTLLHFPFHWYWIVKYGSLSCCKSLRNFNTKSFTPCLCIVGIWACNFNKPKSLHAFALLAFEPVTSTNQSQLQQDLVDLSLSNTFQLPSLTPSASKHSSLLSCLIIPKHSFTSAKVLQYFVREIKRERTMEKMLKSSFGRNQTYHCCSHWYWPYQPKLHWTHWLHTTHWLKPATTWPLARPLTTASSSSLLVLLASASASLALAGMMATSDSSTLVGVMATSASLVLALFHLLVGSSTSSASASKASSAKTASSGLALLASLALALAASSSASALSASSVSLALLALSILSALASMA